MLDAPQLKALAEELDRSEKTRQQLGHFSRRFPDMTIEDGYKVQREWIKLKLGQGRSVKGHKIGLTSRAMQQASEITEPDYGVLLDDMFIPESGDIERSRFIAPRIEVELAFVLSRPLEGANVSIFDVLNATDHVVPAIEIIDARIAQREGGQGPMRKVMDTISDNAANAGIIVGGRPVKPHDVDLRWISALLYRNAVIEETGVAAGVLNHPATGVAWLARKLAAWGERLEAGETVLSGSFTRPVFAEAGDTFHADYGQLGSISFRFV
jgi:2-oxo-hept-3-ene-1,7-dioate hydratase